MQEALYEPFIGYYSCGGKIPGKTGDFYTSVSVGAVFGKLLGEHVLDCWEAMGKPPRFQVIEQGANEGQLAYDLLSYLTGRHPQLLQLLSYVIIEPAPLLQKTQQSRLQPNFNDKVKWVSAWTDEKLEPVVGVVLSNELVDSFPVHLIRKSVTDWVELYVGSSGSDFQFIQRPILSKEILTVSPETLEQCPVGYTTEVHPSAREWMGELSAKLHHGVVTTIDYGFDEESYYTPTRSTGTLRAYYKHQQNSDVLARPGEQDLTSHVNFTLLQREGLTHGLGLLGYANQARFLTSLCEELLTSFSTQELNQFKTLTHPQFLGSKFQVMIQGKGQIEKEKIRGLRFAKTYLR